jgi:hypothetical protein
VKGPPTNSPSEGHDGGHGARGSASESAAGRRSAEQHSACSQVETGPASRGSPARPDQAASALRSGWAPAEAAAFARPRASRMRSSPRALARNRRAGAQKDGYARNDAASNYLSRTGLLKSQRSAFEPGSSGSAPAHSSLSVLRIFHRVGYGAPLLQLAGHDGIRTAGSFSMLQRPCGGACFVRRRRWFGYDTLASDADSHGRACDADSHGRACDADTVTRPERCGEQPAVGQRRFVYVRGSDATIVRL